MKDFISSRGDCVTFNYYTAKLLVLPSQRQIYVLWCLCEALFVVEMAKCFFSFDCKTRKRCVHSTNNANFIIFTFTIPIPVSNVLSIISPCAGIGTNLFYFWMYFLDGISFRVSFSFRKVDKNKLLLLLQRHLLSI